MGIQLYRDYDVEADWFLLMACNYRCDYCFLDDGRLSSKIRVHADPDRWAEGFAATGRTWLLHLTGGEPSIYPDFVKLCKTLSNKHYLSLNSNLTGRAYEKFAGEIDPRRVHFINAGIHIEERERRGHLDLFCRTARLLLSAGFNLLPSLVMSPGAIAQAHELFKDFDGREIYVLPKALRGPYRGKTYPGAYSEAERELIRERLAAVTPRYAEMKQGMGEAPTVDLFSEGDHLQGPRRFRGRLCASGYSFVRLTERGKVFRCGTMESLGGVLEGDVRLAPGPKRCNAKYCPYFCRKYTAAGAIPEAPLIQRKPDE